MQASLAIIAKKLKQKFPDLDIEATETEIKVKDYEGKKWKVVSNQDFLAFMKAYLLQRSVLSEMEMTPVPGHSKHSKKKPNMPDVMGPPLGEEEKHVK